MTFKAYHHWLFYTQRQWPLCFSQEHCMLRCFYSFVEPTRRIQKEAKTFWNLSAPQGYSAISCYMGCAHMLRAACWAWAFNRAAPFSPSYFAKNLTKNYQNDLGVEGPTYFGFFWATCWQKRRPEKLFELDVSWGISLTPYRYRLNQLGIFF